MVKRLLVEPRLQLEPHRSLVEQRAEHDFARASVVHRVLDSERITGKCEAIPVQAGPHVRFLNRVNARPSRVTAIYAGEGK